MQSILESLGFHVIDCNLVDFKKKVKKKEYSFVNVENKSYLCVTKQSNQNMKGLQIFTGFMIIVIVISFIGLIRSSIKFSKNCDDLIVKLHQPRTVYIHKINDTTFQQDNVTFIIR